MDECLLRGAIKEIVRIFYDVLIERIAARNEHRKRNALPSACSSGLLPRTRHCSRITVQYTRLQLPNIDPELQRVRADDTADFPAAKSALNFPAQLRQIPAPITANRLAAQLVLDSL